MTDDLDKLHRRYVRLLSLLEETSRRIGDPNLLLAHADPSFLAFDPRHPSPWLEDVGQATYLLRNHKQVVQQDRAGFMSRLLLLPSRPPVVGPSIYVYYAAVKAVVHLQLYEGMTLWIAFAKPRVSLDMGFNFSAEQVGRHVRVWPSPDYYSDMANGEAIEAEKSEAERYQTMMANALRESIRLAPYRDAHFLPGERLALPKSWRQFLLRLTGRKCTMCPRPLTAAAFQIDHGRALNPEDDQCRPTPSGNSNMFNLAALCEQCNRQKTNKGTFFPETMIPSLLPNLRLREYFRASLLIPPSLARHELPERAPANGQFS